MGEIQTKTVAAKGCFTATAGGFYGKLCFLQAFEEEIWCETNYCAIPGAQAEVSAGTNLYAQL